MERLKSLGIIEVGWRSVGELEDELNMGGLSGTDRRMITRGASLGSDVGPTESDGRRRIVLVLPPAVTTRYCSSSELSWRFDCSMISRSNACALCSCCMVSRI